MPTTTADALDRAAATVLDRAADLIAVAGWARGTFEQDGRHCMVGAIAAVVPLDPIRFRMARAAVEAECKARYDCARIIVANDYHVTDEAEAAAVLRAAAERLRGAR